MELRPGCALAGLLAAATLVSCSESPDVLRFSGIPDADKSRLLANAEVVQKYLTKELGMPVEFVESASYTAACNGVASNKLDLAWLGGVTSVQAEERSGGKVKLIACRKSDLRFKSYFIASKAAIREGRIRKVDDLAAAKDMLAGCTFTFGSKASTSGRVMPQYFMEQAGIEVAIGVKGGPKFQLEGGHVATLNAVNSGSVDVGVLNYKTYDEAAAAKKANTEIIYTTPTYVDYCLVAHERLGPEMLAKIREAFLKLDPPIPEHGAVLEAFSARKFVPARSKDWDQIRAVLKKIKLD